MNRRLFLEALFGIFALSGFSILAGCSKKEKTPRSGNQEKLWQMAAIQEKSDEPLELSYAKNTPAFYRDASLGKADPNFKPVTGGG